MSAIFKRADSVMAGDILAGGLVVVERGIGLGDNPYIEIGYWSPKFKKVIYERVSPSTELEMQP